MGPKPKLLLFSHLSGVDVMTGAEKLFLLFIRELAAHFDCRLVVPQEGVLAAQARAAGIGTIEMELPLSLALFSALPQVDAEIGALPSHPAWEPLVFLMLRESPDYVWTNTTVHPMPAMAATSLGIPTIWSVMETMRNAPHRPQAAAIVSLYSQLIVGISDSVLEPYRESGAGGKTVVLRPYVEPSAHAPERWPDIRARQRSRLGFGEENFVAGFVAATIYPNKGLLEFVHAMVPLMKQHPGVRAMIVGKSVDEAYVHMCREFIWRQDLSSRFAWMEFREQIEEIYAPMDAVVVPSLVPEGFGMTALEGMMFGKPVVAFAAGGLREILEQAEAGAWLVTTGHTQGLTERLSMLLSDPALRQSLGANNARLAAERFSVGRFREALGAWLRRLPPPASARPEAPQPEIPQQGLLRGAGKGTVYLIQNGRKRPFTTPKALRDHGFRFEDIRDVPELVLDFIPDGEPLIEAASRRPRRGRRRLRKRGRSRIRGMRSGAVRRGGRGRRRIAGRSGGRRRRKSTSARKRKGR
ncbi:glycosyltransferase family 4 protein [Cohnella rhizosphaerae]|uniref:Glycosyltransferase family 4 protein n=1 Tax=Cohnella rhizosphaerae TaxID=1457232 RepID=A0A9X4L197_9BACL|nr:glycosyltransferase family 4 protein [Cohnella rhizosphaerae]MDG0814685.1 glycosyltransferase family 4 protein [Cohnella rhizosphaerae]